MRKSSLDVFFKPESVAVIGASEKAQTIGQALVYNLLKDEFPGTIYPVNRKYQEIQGLRAYPIVTEVKAPIDLAIIAIPIRDVPSAMQECGEAGIHAAIIISAGGKETGLPGKEIEAAIKAEAKKAGIRYLGPNSLGLFCPSSKLHASFVPHCAQPGNLAFISQSGALCSSILGWAVPKKIGFSHLISVGSMADVDFGDLIDYLGNEERARRIVMYMENLTQPRKFMSAARSVSRIKPIIVIKAGRSRAGAQAAASHTGAMAGRGPGLQCRVPTGRDHPSGHHRAAFRLRRSPGKGEAPHRRQPGHYQQCRGTGDHGGGCPGTLEPGAGNPDPGDPREAG